MPTPISLPIESLPTYNSPQNGDVVPIVDIANDVTKCLAWSDLKASLKAYFDPFYTLKEGEMRNGLIVPSQGNYISNPSFESDLSGWVAYNSSTNTRQTSQHFDGAASMRMVMPGGGGNNGAYFTLTNLIIGKAYTFSAYLLGAVGGETGSLYIGGANNEQQAFVLTTSWQCVSVTFVPTASSVIVYAWGSTASATLYVDAVQVNIGVTAAAYEGYGNLYVAIKTLAGNDPSASDPVKVMIGGVVRTITAATYMGMTLNSGTGYLNLGSAELATKETDIFTYLLWDSLSSSVRFLISRIPFGSVISDFYTADVLHEKSAYSNTSAWTASDTVVNIGRFAATLSAGGGYTWSVPTFTASNLIQRPIYEGRDLSWSPQLSGSGSMTINTVGIDGIAYSIRGNKIHIEYKIHFTTATAGATYVYVTLPFANNKYMGGACTIYDGGNPIAGTVGFNGSNVLSVGRADASNWTLGAFRYALICLDYSI